jgi:DNA polymerase-1
MHTRVKRRIIGSGTRAEVYIWGEAPGDDEAEAGFAFVGRAGKLLDKILGGPDGFGNKRVVIDNVCPRYLGRDEKRKYIKPDTETLKRYRDYRQDTLSRWKPRTMVLMGESALRAFGRAGSVTAQAGKIVSVDGIPTVLGVHPAYVLRNPKEMHLLKKTFRAVHSCLKVAESKFPVCQNPEHLRIILDAFPKKEPVSVDLETSSLGPNKASVLTASLSCGKQKKQTLTLPLFHPEGPGAKTAEKLLRVLLKWWPQGPRIVHNSVFELSIFDDQYARRGLTVRRPKEIFDTLINAWLINEIESVALSHHVVHTLERKPYWLGIPNPKKVNFSEVPLGKLLDYNGNDALHCWLLDQHQHKELRPEMKRLSKEVWTPLARLLVDLRERGVHCNLKKLAKASDENVKAIEEAERKISRYKVNPRSTKQLAKLLFDDWGLRPRGKTPGGDNSTSEKVLKKLAAEEPRVLDFLELRKLQSLQSRVFTRWPEDAADGFLRPYWHISSTVSGRLTTTDPNLLNVDRTGSQRVALDSRFDRGKILQGDYAQHELRTYAVVAEDEIFIRAWKKNPKMDPHGLTKKDMEAKGVELTRDNAKNTNFGIIFGITESGLLEKYLIPIKHGRELLSTWKEVHPWLERYWNGIDQEIRNHGYTESVVGMRRHVLHRDNPHERRSAYNFGIQHFAAFICFLAMMGLDRMMIKRKMKSVIDMNVHDSIRIDCHPKEVRSCKKMTEDAMLGVNYQKYLVRDLPCDIPLGVDIKVGEHM